MTPAEQTADWIAKQLATSRPFTQSQQQILRRLLLPQRRSA